MLLILTSPAISCASGRLLNTSAAIITFTTSPPTGGLMLKTLTKCVTFPDGIYPALGKELQHKSWYQLKVGDTYIAQGWYKKDTG